MRRSSGVPFPPTKRGHRSFTLVELLVATAIFFLLMMILLSLASQGSGIMQKMNREKTNREVARVLLECIGRDLEATVFPFNASSTTSLRFQQNPASLRSGGYLNPNALFWQTAWNGTSSTNGDIADVGYFVKWVIDSTGMAHGTLCRMGIPPTSADSIFQSQTLNASLLNKYAPGLADTVPGSSTAYKGLMADNVLGLWIILYDRKMVRLTSPYDSRTTSRRPAYADISIAVLDPQIARRINSSNLGLMITDHYAGPTVTNATVFVSQLPASIRAGAQAFETRVPIYAGQ